MFWTNSVTRGRLIKIPLSSLLGVQTCPFHFPSFLWKQKRGNRVTSQEAFQQVKIFFYSLVLKFPDKVHAQTINEVGIPKEKVAAIR